MESIKINHEGLINLEQPMIKVSVELLKRQFKSTQKQIEKELLLLSKSCLDSLNPPLPETCKDAISRLENLKDRLQQARIQEESIISRSKARFDYLNQVMDISTVDDEKFDRWSKTRLNHLLVDFLSRQGYTQTATKLALDSNIDDLVDLELFTQAQKIQKTLESKNCFEALQWCAENKSALKKIKSSLEFNLRLQEYIELVRERKIIVAIQYAKKFLVPWSDTHLKEIQQASGLLAFEPTTDCQTYKALFDEKRWQTLVQSLQLDMFTLYSLTKEPMLNITLQAGLTALKTHTCSSSENNSNDRNVNCPVCSKDSFGVLAQALPNAHHVNSSLVCRISGKIMDESNPPLVLPNGYVYSTMALKEMQEKEGIIQCPRSGNTYTLSETRKAFIS